MSKDESKDEHIHYWSLSHFKYRLINSLNKIPIQAFGENVALQNKSIFVDYGIWYSGCDHLHPMTEPEICCYYTYKWRIKLFEFIINELLHNINTSILINMDDGYWLLTVNVYDTKVTTRNRRRKTNIILHPIYKINPGYGISSCLSIDELNPIIIKGDALTNLKKLSGQF